MECFVGKKALSLLSCLLLVVLLGGCQRADGGSPMVQDRISDDTALGRDRNSEEIPAIEESQAQEIPTKEYIDASTIEEVTLFHEGVAWVTIEEGKCLIGNDGEVLLDQSESPSSDVSHYCNGGAVVYGDTGPYDYLNPTAAKTIIDKAGNTVWSIEDAEDKAAEVYGDDAVDGVSILDVEKSEWHGYLIVVFKVNTFDYTGPLCGVVNASGEWVVEPLQSKRRRNRKSPDDISRA